MFWKAWKREPAHDPAGDDAAAPRAAGGDAQPPPAQQREQHDDRRRADEAELLAGDAEHEVGLLLGHERAVGLRPVEQAGAEQVPVRDRDVGLVDVVGRALHVLGRIGEGPEALELVAGEVARLAPRTRCRRRRAAAARSSTGPARRRRPARRTWPRTAPAPSRGRAAAAPVRSGRAARTSASTTSRSVGPGIVGAPDAARANSTAQPTIRPSFMNSAGCSSKPPPMTIHARAPLIVDPIASTATSPSSAAQVQHRRRAPAAAASSMRAASTSSTRPIAALNRCRYR